VHALFIDACANQVTAQMIGALRATTHVFEIARLQDRPIHDNTEHLAILDALAAEPHARRARRGMCGVCLGVRSGW
jgi:DNA-binding FadR family transcriptional regulator